MKQVHCTPSIMDTNTSVFVRFLLLLLFFFLSLFLTGCQGGETGPLHTIDYGH